MRIPLFAICLLCLIYKTQAQEYSIISGSETITETVRNGFNSVPYMEASGVSNNFRHIVSINQNGASFGLIGEFSVKSLQVTMPDGKTFNYEFVKEENGFICSELTGSMSRIGATAVGVLFSSASALGKDLEIIGSGDWNASFTSENKVYYGKLTPDKLSEYGTGKSANGTPSFSGNALERENILKINPYSSIRVSGLSPNSYNGYARAVEQVRSAYSSWLQSQKSAAPTTNSAVSISGGNAKTTTSITTNTSNSTTSNKASSEMYQRAEAAGQGLQQMEYERQAAERQRQERLQQATNPGGYYLQKSGVNDYFNAQMDRLNREAAAKERQEEREWLAQQRRKREEETRREREQEQWRKDQLARYAASREQRINDYKAKGGDANYNTKLNQWRAFAQKEIQQVNQYLKNYNGVPLSFAYPQNNCEFVSTIESVQNSEMPNDYKLILIKNVINLRFQYFEFYRENAYNYENWKGFKDSMYWDIPQATCGNFLDQIAYSLGTDMHIGIYGGSSDIFGTDEALFISNSYDERLSADGNYSLPIGASPRPGSYSDVLSEAGIKISKQQITAFTDSHGGDVWRDYHLNPFDWSNGYAFHNESGRYSAGWNYKSKRLAGNQTAIDAEIEKYIAAYDIRRAFSLNTTTDEENMMFFNYSRGALSEAYDNLQRYIIMQFGGYHSLIASISRQTEFDYKLLESAIALTSVLVEVGDYENAKPLAAATLTKAYQLWNQQFNKKPINTYSINQNFAPIYIAANVLKNRLHFILGEYDQMSFTKAKEAIENNVDRTDAIFKYVRVTSSRVWAPTPDELEFLKFKFIGSKDLHLNAYALMNQGRDDLAKLQMEQMVKYYSKKDAPSFVGTSMDIDVFKKLVEKFYSNKADKISYKVGLPDLLKRTIDTQSKDGSRYAFLTRFALNSNATSTLPIIDLSENAEWSQLHSKLAVIETNEESLSETFSKLHELSHNGILVANEASKNYLSEYIQLGLTIGRFHEVLPTLLTYKTLFPEDKSLILEEELSKLMWPQKENLIYKVLDFNEGKAIYHPTRHYFEEEVKNNETLKSRLSMYTFAWSKFGVLGIQIPYLYSLN